MKYIVAFLFVFLVSAGYAADMIIDPLQTARNGRAQIADILTAATKRDAGTVYSVNKLVTKWNLTPIDAGTFGFLSRRVGDNSISCLAGSGNVASASGRFVASDVGKTIHIAGAGVAGATYVGAITAYASANAVTVTPNISTTVSATKTSAGGLAMWGYVAGYTVDTNPLLSVDGTLAYQPTPSSYVFDVKNFGAVGDGVADDTGAINAAFAAASAASKTISSTEIPGIQSYLNSATTPNVLIPSGKYRITSSVGGGANNIRVIGHWSYIFSADRTISLFSLGTVNVELSGLIFDGGAVHVRIGGSRIEAGFVHIHDCQFRNAKQRCIKVDRADIPGFSGYPMNLRVDNCKSYGSGFLEFYCNGVNVRDCWLAWDVAATTWDGGPLFLGNDKLSCVGLCEVPFGTNTNQHPRFQTPPAVFPTEDVLAVTCTDCRFGGEATQTPIMYVRCKGSSLCLNQTAVFGVADGYWLKCDQMPELISVRNCVGDGFVNTWGVWFNSSTITATDIPGLCQIDVDCKTSYTSAYEAFLSASSVVRGGSRFPFVPSQRQFMSGGVQRNICIGDGITWWGAPYTSGSANAGFGGVTPLLGYNLGLISFSGEGYYGIKMPGFNPGVAGVYTFSVVVRTSSRAAWQFVANDGGAIIANGVCDGGVQKIICKFYHSGSGSTTPVFLINGSSGDSHVVGLLKIEAGSTASDFVTPGYTGEPGQLRQFFGSAAPTNGTWRVGDAVINSAPAVGSPKGWRCTVAGTPGTWVSEGNL